MVLSSKERATVFTLFILVPLLLAATTDGSTYRILEDGRGRQVRIPEKIDRIVSVSDGLVEGVMTCLGVQGRLVGLGSRALQRTYAYRYEAEGGDSFFYENGMNPVRYLNPRFADLPLIADGPALNMEALAGLEPDLVFLRLGSCNLPGRDDAVEMTIRMLVALGIPLFILEGPNAAGRPSVTSISQEIGLIGKVFGREAEAARLASYLEEQVEEVRRKTAGIPEGEKSRVLLFGPSSSARKSGAAGQVFGLGTMESFFIEELAGARNAFQSGGAFRLISAENLLALDPDVIVLCTAAGHHPPRELYDAPYCRNLQGMRALKKKRVSALPWTPWNCEKRLEYPIDVMVIAKAAYPDRFADIRLADWLIDFYRNVYGVDRRTAERLRSCQWMDWVLDVDNR